MDQSFLVTLVVGFIILAIIWKIVKGVIRLGLTLAVIAVIAYVLFNYLT